MSKVKCYILVLVLQLCAIRNLCKLCCEVGSFKDVLPAKLQLELKSSSAHSCFFRALFLLFFPHVDQLVKSQVVVYKNELLLAVIG